MLEQDRTTLITTMIADCEAREARLNDWERNFIDSISKQHAEGRLTSKQFETLERVWEKVTDEG